MVRQGRTRCFCGTNAGACRVFYEKYADIFAEGRSLDTRSLFSKAQQHLAADSTLRTAGLLNRSSVLSASVIC